MHDELEDAYNYMYNVWSYEDESYEEKVKRMTTASLWDEVIKDMKARDEFGMKKYGRPLTPRSKVDPLKEAYEEALDMVVYLKAAISKREESPEEQVIKLKKLLAESVRCAFSTQFITSDFGKDLCNRITEALKK